LANTTERRLKWVYWFPKLKVWIAQNDHESFKICRYSSVCVSGKIAMLYSIYKLYAIFLYSMFRKLPTSIRPMSHKRLFTKELCCLDIYNQSVKLSSLLNKVNMVKTTAVFQRVLQSYPKWCRKWYIFKHRGWVVEFLTLDDRFIVQQKEIY
jgi:hypothetical protein